MIVSMHEAKTRLFEFVQMAREGEEVIVTINGEPVVTLQPVMQKGSKKINREGGFFKATRPACTEQQWKEMNDQMLADFEESAEGPLNLGQR